MRGCLKGAEAASTYGKTLRHPFMRRTESVDYAVVLEGRVTRVLVDSEAELDAGDVVIQRGN